MVCSSGTEIAEEVWVVGAAVAGVAAVVWALANLVNGGNRSNSNAAASMKRGDSNSRDFIGTL